jgi:glycosyltransferase involved in cell wall biosynthesis
MRVLHVPLVDWQPTEAIARACWETAAALDAESYLLVDRDPGTRASNAFAGVRVIAGWTPLMPFRPAFARTLRELRPDVVHLHGGTLAPALAFSRLLRATPVVATCYRSAQLPSPRSRGRVGRLGERGMNVSLSRSLATTGGGTLLARFALRRGRIGAICTPDARIEAAFAGAGPVVRAQGAARVSERQARWSDEPCVVFAGRAQAGRGIEDLVAAFPALLRSVPGARLRLALLESDESEQWARRLASAPWADVTIGPADDLEAVFAACHVAAFPFRWSATLTPSLAMAEAMAVGLPVVAAEVDCLAPLVEAGVNGMLVPPENPDALAGALAGVLDGPEVWQPLSEGARKTIDECWSWRTAATHVRTAYEIAIERTAR